MNEKIQEYKEILNKSVGKRDLLTEILEKEQKNLKNLKTLQENIEKAIAFVQKVAKQTQEKVRFQIQDIVQLALDTCFPGVYQFKVEFELKRNRTEAVLYFLKNGEPLNPMDSTGGGVVVLTAFALRIAAWSLGKSDNIMILDEPFKDLSRDLQPLAGKILQRLSKKLCLQIIMVTHNKEMINVSDRVFETTIENGVSKVVQR